MLKSELDKILDRVRKLLSLAGNNPNQHEAASAAEMAKRILNEYNLSLSDIELQEILSKEVTFHELRISSWKQILAVKIAEIFDCRVYGTSDLVNHGGKYKIVFVGNKSDVQVAYYVYEYLYRVIFNLIETKMKNNDSEFHGNTVRHNYAAGIMSVITDRLTEFYGKVKAESDVKVNNYGKTGKEVLVIKNDAISKYVASTVGEMQKKVVGGARVMDVDTYSVGQKDGKNIPLSRGIQYDGSSISGYIGG